MQSESVYTFDKTKPIGNQIYQILRQRIIQTIITPGTKLSESELAAELGVSRQPVREALIKLNNDGLLEIRPQRGTFVKRISQKRVLDVRFVREAIESDIVAELSKHNAPATILELQAEIEKQKLVSDGDYAEFLELDEAFHFKLAKLAGKSYAWDVVQSVKAQMDRVRYLSFADLPTSALIQQHQTIVDTIATGDPAKASQAMRIHLREIKNSLPVIAEKRKEFFEPDK